MCICDREIIHIDTNPLKFHFICRNAPVAIVFNYLRSERWSIHFFVATNKPPQFQRLAIIFDWLFLGQRALNILTHCVNHVGNVHDWSGAINRNYGNKFNICETCIWETQHVRPVSILLNLVLLFFDELYIKKLKCNAGNKKMLRGKFESNIHVFNHSLNV